MSQHCRQSSGKCSPFVRRDRSSPSEHVIIPHNLPSCAGNRTRIMSENPTQKYSLPTIILMLRLKLNSWLEQVSSSSQSNRHLWRNSTKKHISERRRRKIVSIWDANRVSRKSPRGLSFVLLMMLSVEKRFGFEARWDGREISEWVMSFLIRVLETFNEERWFEFFKDLNRFDI